jgi:hypothetical protein
MPDEFDIVNAFKFTPSNHEHEKNRPFDPFVLVDFCWLFAAWNKNVFYSAAKTGGGHRG